MAEKCDSLVLLMTQRDISLQVKDKDDQADVANDPRSQETDVPNGYEKHGSLVLPATHENHCLMFVMCQI